MHASVVIVKIGGSLYDLPDLGSRVARWIQRAAHERTLLVPGGGAAADVIRALDRTHQLGEEAAHWLALRMTQVNAHALAHLLPHARVVASPRETPRLGILDPLVFAQDDEARPGHLPHVWDATSDSLAVRVAMVAQAREVVLLKSVAWDGHDWETARRAGVVDPYFPQIVRQCPEVRVHVVNLRVWQPPR